MVRSFLALFRGSSGRWVVARGRGRDFKKEAQGGSYSLTIYKKFFSIYDGEGAVGDWANYKWGDNR